MTEQETPANLDYSPKRIAWLAQQMSANLNTSIGEIHSINDQTKIISLNAKITSAREGSGGKGFAVVANEIMNLSRRTALAADVLDRESRHSIKELIDISSMLDNHVRGERLSIFTRTNIDLIDRNLYERSCDVRWWATDNSLVEALTQGTEDALSYACQRLGVILSAYTVYYDLVLADSSGKIVANGRPDIYHSQGSTVSKQTWFQQAMQSRSGDDYGLQSVHASPLVNHERVLIYSCAVRENGSSHGKVIGALGIIFNWDSLAQVVVNNTPISEEEWKNTRVCIADKSGLILADTQGKQLNETLSFAHNDIVFSNTRGFLETQLNRQNVFVAHAPAEGFETYNTSWYSILIQTLE